MAHFKASIAQRFGIRAAIIAQFIWETILNDVSDDTFYKFGNTWTRCSIKTITVVFPFLTRSQIKHAIKLLVDAEVLRKGSFNEDRFDRTNWYSFTEYGMNLMKAGDPNEVL